MSNNRTRCQNCSHRVTNNQLKASKGICIYCKFDIETDRFKKQMGSIRLDPKIDFAALFALCRSEDMTAIQLIQLAVDNRLRVWNADTNELKKDLMLDKLYTR